ncbi:MAG: glycosyltransferase family 4 protein [Desulfuromonadaceae bacterium]|nr:glycosyltransferase family 4 protein [Desulfuromonadaceae bacterium]
MAKICVVTSVHPPNDPRLFKLCKSIQRLGHDCILISSWPESLDLPSLKFYTFPLKSGLLGRIKNMLNILKLSIKADADIYHFHDLDILPLFTLFYIFNSKPVIYDIHENYSEEVLVRYWIPNIIRLPLYYFVKVTQKLCSRIIKNCIIVVDSIRNEISAETTNILLHKNYASESILTTRNDDYDSRINKVLFIGSQYIENGSLLFVEIAKHILSIRRDIHFSCIDRFGNNLDLREHILGESGGVLLNGNFHILQNLPSHELMIHINEAKIGISPNMNVPKQVKAIPTKLFEYMAGGIPIVASDLPSNRFYIETTGGGLLATPDSVESFSEKIIYLIDNTEEAKNMGVCGLLNFKEKYTWESQDKSLDYYYNRILKGNTCSQPH